MRNVAIINGPNYLPPDDELRDRVHDRWRERSTYPAGMLRQFDAVLGTGSLLRYAKAVTAPTVVLHGSDDPMLRVRNGRAVAAAIPGARFVVIDGMGHDLPKPVWRPIVERVDGEFRHQPDIASLCAFLTRQLGFYRAIECSGHRSANWVRQAKFGTLQQ